MYKAFLFFYFSLVSIRIISAQTNPPAQQIPYVQDFGNNWYLLAGLPQGIAVWTANGAPCTSNSSAASSTPLNNENSFDSATVLKSSGKAYGYSGINSSGIAINNGQFYIQTSGSASGTDQLVLAINTTGCSGITLSFEVEMMNPQPKLTGFALQYRIGTSGNFTTIDSSYWHNSVDRLQNQIDYFENLNLPSSVDNQSMVQIRWATSRHVIPLGSGSCGLGFDNIIVNGIQSSPLFFRSIASGNWNSTTTWESSSDNINWFPAARCPNSSENKITLRAPNSVNSSGISNMIIDEIVIDSGAVFWNAYGTILAINDGPGAIDVDINGTFVDSSNYSIVWAMSARWRLSSNATLIKPTNTNSTNWQLKYYNGISNIPSTSNWICRKPSGSSVEPSISTTNGGPPNPQVFYGNLIIENNAASWNPNNLCKLSGSVNYPVIKGNLLIGGNGNNPVNFYNLNSNVLPVRVNGNVIIKTGSTLTVSGTGIDIKGDFICDGNYTNFGSASKLLFSGNTSQNISGIGSISTYKMEINKPSDDVQVNNNVNVFGNLNLLSGKVYTYSLTKIIINNDATASNASDISFINGPLQKKGDDTFTFPIGKLNNYQPLSLNIGTGAQSTDAFTAEYIYDIPSTVYGSALGPGLDHISQCEYWYLTNDAGNSIKNVTLYWDLNSCGVSNLSALRVARYNSTLWMDEGNTNTSGNVNSGFVTSSATTGFGPFTLASATQENSLPISLLSFTASYNGKEVKLIWVTASEINNQLFTVERSSDGVNFESLITKLGAGNSTELLSYTTDDLSPLKGISYYRLKQTNFDGKSSFSYIVPLRIKIESIEIVDLISSKENSSIEFNINFPNPVKGLAEVNDNTGKTVLSTAFSTQTQLKHFSLNSNNLSSGIYFLRIVCGTETIIKKFIY